jgi:hypothetical protein
MMSKWEISMEDAIEATKPLPKYEGTWASLLSEADAKYKKDLLKGDHTLYDWEVTNSRNLLQEAQDDFAAAEKLIAGIIKAAEKMQASGSCQDVRCLPSFGVDNDKTDRLIKGDCSLFFQLLCQH